MPATNSKNGAWANPLGSLSNQWRAVELVLRRNSLVLIATSCLLAVLLADAPSLSGAVFLLTCLLLAWTVAPRLFLACAVLCMLCGALHHWRVELEKRLHERFLAQVGIEGVFHITTPPRLSDDTWSAQANIDGKKIEVQGRHPAPRVGAALQGKGIVLPWENPRNEGQFDYPNWLKRNGILASVRLQNVKEDPSQLHSLRRLLDDMRVGLRNSITAGIETGSNEAKVILAMVLGEQPGREDDILTAFRLSGTLHLFSVSGQHVNLVAMILWIAMRFLRVPRRYAIALLIPSIFLYAYVTGASPPAIRAAWMAAVFLAAFWFQRKPYILGTLAIVMICALFLDSHLIFLAGVQLSYGVVAAISVGLSLCKHRIQRWSQLDEYLPRELYTPWQERWMFFKKGTAQSLAVSTSACVGSAPLGVVHFGMITPISIIANLLMTPFVALILGLALLAAALHPVLPFASAGINRANALVARVCISISENCSAIPGANWQWSIHYPKHDTIRIFDLPRGGGASMFQLKQADLMLDTGSMREKRTIISSLSHFGCNPDCLLLSHAESDHIGYAEEMLHSFPIRQIISPVAESRATSFRSLISRANQRELAVLLAQPITMQLSHHVKCHVIPTLGCREKRLPADDRVCLYHFDFHGFGLLFANDVSPAELKKLWPSLHSPIDVLVLGRHEMHHWPIDHWDLNPPRVVIASHADFPTRESVPDDWRSFLQSNGITVLSQQDTGMVSIHVNDAGELCLRGFLGNECKLSRRLHD